jgi:small subunit ribosomal protein S6
LRNYEIMLILPAEADEQVVSAVVDRINRTLADTDGKVGKIDRWGRKRFAFEIDRQTEGYYVVVELTSDPTAMRELERVLSLADEVIRFKTTVRAAA